MSVEGEPKGAGERPLLFTYVCKSMILPARSEVSA